MGKKVLIVGGVAGGASCAARLRRLDETAEIIVFERGEYVSYANCGLPYYVGGVIRQRNALILVQPEVMRAKYNIDVRIRQEVTAVDRAAKTVTVKKLDTGETYTESYDKLVLSTGSSPIRPPIPGIDSNRIMTLWTVPDSDRIRAFIKERNAKTAAVIGGGFIGLEMAENLHLAGLKVSVIEMLDQVMAPLDFEMAQLLHEHLVTKGVDLHLGDGVDSFEETDACVTVTLKSGKKIPAELVILSIGVRPNGELAKAAGLEINARGGIVVSDTMLTSDPDIYAVGDVVEVEDFIDKSRTMIPLAGPANKQGRIAADNIARDFDKTGNVSAEYERYEGTQGTFIAKVFDMAAAATGQNEKILVKNGLVKGRDFETVIVTQNSHASYYPGSIPMNIKLIFSKDGSKIFGAQIVGGEGVDKRIDTIAVTIRLGGSVRDLKTLELAYAPPFSSAKDPVNMAGFVAENVLTGKAAFAPWDIDITDKNVVALDVREDVELQAYVLPAYTQIPLGQLRKRLGELDRDKEIIIFCAVGIRAYNAARILMENGFKNVKVYPGGVRFYQSMHYTESETTVMNRPDSVSDSGNSAGTGTAGPGATASMRLDCSGLQCPGPILKVFETMKDLKTGDILEVSASDPGFARDIVSWTRRTGNTLISNEKHGGNYVALVQKTDGSAAPAPNTASCDGKTIIVFSGDLDKVLASFIIANGAAAMGRKVTMFFTFWGLNVLRKANKVKVGKDFTEKMFGGLMPRGAGRLKLSKMNMLGLGTRMMKGIMKKKRVDSLEELIRKAQQNGVRIIACTMSMDVMGIRKEELIDGIDYAGVSTYLGEAEESNVNLFI
jgi:NADPH-dependent 2,4-dienoyl-CoA reductase/sulfur reductase-like enzyme/peroxiredoxin family protein/TusA-related sulfurtransferase/rhodanese-related sulfurtransferase